MRKFVALNYLNESDTFPSNAVQNLRQAVLFPDTCKPKIQEALQNINFSYHPPYSYSDLIRACNVAEGETLLMFWGCNRSESRFTVMSSSSCSSTHLLGGVRERELRSSAQQTDISCSSPEPTSSVLVCPSEEQHLAFPAPGSPLLPQAPPSLSILGSVCALLLKQGSSSRKEVSSVLGNRRSGNICRICYGGESAERLVRPCACRGTIAAVHRKCLERWLLQAARSYCELCRHHYVVTRTHKWSWARSLAEWARAGRGRALLADAWRGAALGAASVLGTARALNACDRALQAGARAGGGAVLAANLFSSLLIGVIVYFVVGALNGLLTTWVLLKIQEHQLSWRAWRDATLHVHVSLADEESLPPTPLDPTPRASDATVVAGPPRTADRSTNVADPFMVALPDP